jgi:RNA recognition motif. (a.k.a. RRM, RBD, or RNP domain)
MESHSSVPYSSSDSSPTINSCSIDALEDHAIDESNTLFLGDLPPSATAQQISDLFPDFEVSHVEIKIINSVKGSLCYAFVTFATAGNFIAHDNFSQHWATCLNIATFFPQKTLNKVLRSMTVTRHFFRTVLWSGWAGRKEIAVFMSLTSMRTPRRKISSNSSQGNTNLLTSIIDDNLEALSILSNAHPLTVSCSFCRYGDLNSQDGVTVIKKPSSNPQIQNQIVCYGVIHYDLRDGAEAAKNNLNNTYFGGRRLRVEWNRASRKSLVTRFGNDEMPPSEPLLHYSSMSPVISIYVQFETLDSESRVTESLITEIFEHYGNMTGCFIKTNNTSVSGLRQHGYAFVHFDNRCVL